MPLPNLTLVDTPLLLSILLDVALMGALLVLARLAWRRRHADDLRARAQARQLAAAVAETARCNRHVQTLSELNHALRACTGFDDAMAALGTFLPRLFGVAGGALFVAAAPDGTFRRAHQWGSSGQPPSLAPADCRALRSGAAYVQPAGGSDGGCRHLPVGPARAAAPPAVCVPLTADGGVIALLTLDCAGSDPNALLEDLYTRSTIEEVGVVVGNIRLREVLRQQSIRDPLTGLYNRRYLEESLRRELVRVERRLRDGRQSGLALLMLDVDHFKRFNDEHGHEAGDIVLAELGRLLRGLARGSDIVSRYGGEEFVVVLPDISLDGGRSRSERIREAVGRLSLGFRGQPLPAVTVSIGVAASPEHGASPEALIRAADAAMYEAKHAGRNRVCVAAVAVSEVPIAAVAASGAAPKD